MGILHVCRVQAPLLQNRKLLQQSLQVHLHFGFVFTQFLLFVEQQCLNSGLKQNNHIETKICNCIIKVDKQYI